MFSRHRLVLDLVVYYVFENATFLDVVSENRVFGGFFYLVPAIIFSFEFVCFFFFFFSHKIVPASMTFQPAYFKTTILAHSIPQKPGALTI
jgi:hypothetical protein